MKFAFTAIIFLASATWAEENQRVFQDDLTKIAIERPEAWKFDRNIHYAKVEKKDGEFTKSEEMPLIIGLVKTTDTGTVCLIDQVNTKEKTSLGAANQKISNLANKFQGMKVLVSPETVPLGSLETTHITYTLKTLSKSAVVDRTFENWYWLSQAQVYRLQCSTPTEKYSTSSDEFSKIAGSVKIN